MPVSYAIDAAKARVRTRCEGFTTLDEVLAHFDELNADPACPPVLDVLLDLSEETSLPTPEKLREVVRAAGAAPRVSFRHVAIVAQQDALAGLMSVFEVYAHRIFKSTAVFHDAVEAEAWLDLLQDASR